MHLNLSVCFVLLLLVSAVFAQRPKVHHGGRVVHHRTNHNYNVIKISRAKAKTVCPVFEDTGYPYHGLGVKLGDPFAVTYKYYASKHFSLGIDAGRSASGLYSRYYREIFPEFINTDTLGPMQSIEYMTHRVNSDWVAELRALYHIKADRLSQGLQLYAGLGWEFRKLNISYDFFVNDGPLENKVERITVDRFTYGIQATIGIEYSYFSLPVSAFMELDLYNDLLKSPGYRRIQGGVGLRYVF
ncbi:MAG: hypothetical protein L6Q51_04825 [Cyclobacteriaceae bacterium]|nr:hypothetical protein [Cyclobacteriaceae bacterium]